MICPVCTSEQATRGQECPACRYLITDPAPPADYTIKILPNGAGIAGKLADAEITFNAGILAGLRLIGFAIYERRGGNGRNVTFPARTYSLQGERRSFALLRPDDYSHGDINGQNTVRDAILAAYADWEDAQQQYETERIADFALTDPPRATK